MMEHARTGMCLAISKWPHPISALLIIRLIWKMVRRYVLSPRSKHRIARGLYILAGEDLPRGPQQAWSVECVQDICAASTRPAFLGLQSSHILLCWKDGWGVEIYSWLSGVMLRSPSWFTFGTQKRPVGVRFIVQNVYRADALRSACVWFAVSHVLLGRRIG